MNIFKLLFLSRTIYIVSRSTLNLPFKNLKIPRIDKCNYKRIPCKNCQFGDASCDSKSICTKVIFVTPGLVNVNLLKCYGLSVNWE